MAICHLSEFTYFDQFHPIEICVIQLKMFMLHLFLLHIGDHYKYDPNQNYYRLLYLHHLIYKLNIIKKYLFSISIFCFEIEKKQQLQCGLIQCLIETLNLNKLRTLVVF
jgi:hypothetical protein